MDRKTAIKGLLTSMYLACSPSQLPDGEALDAMVLAWGLVLQPVPDAYLRACYLLAMDKHAQDATARRFPLSAPEVLGAWYDEREAVILEQRRQTQAALPPPLPYVPAAPATGPRRIPYQAATTLAALLAALAVEIGAPCSVLAVLEADRALRRHDPAATVADWRARLDSVRAADSAPTLHSLVTALLPAPVESEAAE